MYIYNIWPYMYLDTRKYTHIINTYDNRSHTVRYARDDRPIGTSATELHEHVLTRRLWIGQKTNAGNDTKKWGI